MGIRKDECRIRCYLAREYIAAIRPVEGLVRPWAFVKQPLFLEPVQMDVAEILDVLPAITPAMTAQTVRNSTSNNG